MAGKIRRKLQPLAVGDVRFDEGFWAKRMETNRRVTLPIEYAQCKKTGRIDALKREWRPGEPNPPHHFWDSDLAKWLEAVGYALAAGPDKKLEKLADGVVDLIAASQEPDGYLNTYCTTVCPGKRWTNLRQMHELYCAGHLMEAAVAYHQATGKRTFLDVMCRYADHIDSVFGRRRGKKRGYPGHPELELALVKLYRATGDRKYLTLAKYFVDERGRRPLYFDVEGRAREKDPTQYDPPRAEIYDNQQAHLPVRRQATAEGHAVRACYLYCGMANVAGETGDAELLAACKRIWRSITKRRMYLTGGVGSTRHGERFTFDYDLPDTTAYAETCAAIALVFFAHRMLQIEADGRYADVMERALYNGVLSGVSLDGSKFFYANPLAAAPGADPVNPDRAAKRPYQRSEWFPCACCPPNLARLIASLGPYVYSTSPRAAYVHLYAAGSATARIAGRDVSLTQKTRYPWDGTVRITVGTEKPAAFALMLRIPGWSRGHRIRANGKAVAAPVAKGYARIRRRWHDGDTVELSLPMPVERIAANPRVDSAAGKVALMRGPIVYCLEQCDHAADVRGIILPDKARLTARFDGRFLGGCVVIEGRGRAPKGDAWTGRLYRPADDIKTVPTRIKAVPYCLWNNRKPGSMRVFF